MAYGHSSMQESIEALKQIFKNTQESILTQGTEYSKNLSADPEYCRAMIPLSKDLLKFTSSPFPSVAENSIITLINMTSNCPFAVNDLIKNKAVNRLLDSVLALDATFVHKRLMLLTNLTTEHAGTLQLLDLHDEALKGQRLLRLAVKFATSDIDGGIAQATTLNGLPIMTNGPTDDYEYAAQILMNATLVPQGREILYQHPDFFMPALLNSISSDNIIRKQGIIGVMRNLAFDESKHEFLLDHVKVLKHIIQPLIPKDIEDNLTAHEMLLKVFPGLKVGQIEPLAINRRHLLETLLLFAASDYGHDFLQQNHVVFVMREVDAYETDEQNRELSVRIGARILPPEDIPDADDLSQIAAQEASQRQPQEQPGGVD